MLLLGMWLDACLLVEIALKSRSDLVYLPEKIVFWLVTRRKEAIFDRTKLHRGEKMILPIICVNLIIE